MLMNLHQEKKKMKRISKRHKENKKSLNKKEPYSLAEAITVLKNTKKTMTSQVFATLE